ncbi:MAG: hypothetical protein JNL11_17500 [Bdellovibrionaceae bacterium]|nr:hypothetical protein [Pseudobdellovibrionaceae bacterium]
MAGFEKKGLDVPYQNPITGDKGILSFVWQNWFRILYTRVYPLGIEITSEILNNIVDDISHDPENINGMQFDNTKVNQVIIEYLIQRIYGPDIDPTELIQSGIFILVYKPAAKTWHIIPIGTPGPDNAGVTFSVLPSGQVRYTSTNFSGEKKYSKITWRARTLAGKVT